MAHVAYKQTLRPVGYLRSLQRNPQRLLLLFAQGNIAVGTAIAFEVTLAIIKRSGTGFDDNRMSIFVDVDVFPIKPIFTTLIAKHP
jgi:hypothetical protein